MIVEIIPCLSDNYSYLIHEKETGTISIVDPSEFNACDKIISKYKKLDFILNKLTSYFRKNLIFAQPYCPFYCH